MEVDSEQLVIKQEIKEEEEVSFDLIEDQSYSLQSVKEDNFFSEYKQVESCQDMKLSQSCFIADGIKEENKMKPKDIYFIKINENMESCQWNVAGLINMLKIKVKFIDDGIIDIVPITYVKKRKDTNVGDIKKVKWRGDGRYYEAEVLEITRNRETDVTETQAQPIVGELRGSSQQQFVVSKDEDMVQLETAPPSQLSGNRETDVTETQAQPIVGELSGSSQQQLVVSKDEDMVQLETAPPSQLSGNRETDVTETQAQPIVGELSGTSQQQFVVSKDEDMVQLETAPPSQLSDDEPRTLEDLIENYGKELFTELPHIDDLLDFSPSESEYVPSENSEESDEDAGLEAKNRPILNFLKTNSKILEGKKVEKHKRQNEKESLTNNEHRPEEHNNENKAKESLTQNQCRQEKLTGIKVEVAKKKEDGKRKWDQRNCCIFCDSLVTNFNRHVERKHSDQLEVAKALALPAKSKERKLLLSKLKKKGNFYHNKKVLREKNGVLIVGRRPAQENCSSEDYLPCSDCLGFFKKSKLFKHSKSCKNKKRLELPTHKNFVQSKGSALLVEDDNKFTLLNSTIFCTMNLDEICKAVKSDSLICQFGTRCLSKSTERHSKNYISTRMRELGRLLLDLRKKFGTSKDLKDFILPHQYIYIIEAVKNVAQYDVNTGLYGIPSLAKKLGHSLRQCAEILECVGLTTDNDEIVQSARNFVIVFDKNWQYDVSSRALKSMEQKKWNKPSMLPLAKDIQALYKYIKDMEKQCKEQLSVSIPTESTWRCLNEVTLAHIILLNRRRSGEVQRIELKSYLNLEKWGEQDEIYQGLSATEKLLTKSLLRMEIRGKRGRVVPVLLIPSIKESIDCLVANRQNCNVLQSNPYLFAIPNTTEGCVRGSDVLRKIANICGAETPQFLTSTKLRKHVATVAQILELNYKDLEQLAKFMGHDINVHSNFYRLPDQTVQVAKLGKLFLAMEKGNISQFKGKSIDEIDINIEDDDVDSSENDSDPDDLSHTTNCQKVTEQKRSRCKPRNNKSAEEARSKEIVLEEQVQGINPKSAGKTYSRILSDSEEDETEIKPIRSIPKRRKSAVRKAWSNEEKEAVLRHLHKNILLKKVPSKSECVKCKDQEPILYSRSWTNIKDWVYNSIKHVS